MVIEQEVVQLLVKILVDQRHDWPTNGAAIALLQYSHTSLSNQQFYIQLDKYKVINIVSDFLSLCNNVETRRHLHEILTLMDMAR